MMLMLVLVLIVVVMMLVLMLMLVMVVMMLMVMAGALGIVALAVVMMMVVMGLLVNIHQRILGLNGAQQRGGGQLVPGSGDDACVRVDGAQKLNALFQLFGSGDLGAGKHDALGRGNLVGEELAEIAGVHPAAVHVRHGGAGFQRDIDLLRKARDHVAHLGELANAGGLDDHAVGMILVDELDERVVEIARQGAADAAGIELGDLDAGILHERAVDANLAVFVLEEHQLLAFKRAAGEQLLDERGLARAKETGNYIYSGHFIHIS